MPHHSRQPSYRLHKPSGQAVVTIGGHDHYLGTFDSPESHAEYDRLIGEWFVNGRRPHAANDSTAELSMNEVILAFWQHVEGYYRQADGAPTSEVKNFRLALHPLKELYGHTSAGDFDSIALETVRTRMIQCGRCRSRINKDVSRIKRLFRWAAAKRLVPVSVCQLLDTVEGLRRGRTEARETEPVKPVLEVFVEATLPYLRPQTAAMVKVQLLTGMRPGEIVLMRTIDLDMGGKVWWYRPGSDQGPCGRHKNAYRGQQRVVSIGPRAQEVLKPWLRLNLYEYLFSPAEAEAQRDAERRAARKTPLYPSSLRQKRKRNPKKAPGVRYTALSYSQAIRMACKKANAAARAEALETGMPEEEAAVKVFVPHWHPNQLRHTHATEVRRRFGLEAAQVALGHAQANITEVYAERDLGLAVKVAAEIG